CHVDGAYSSSVGTDSDCQSARTWRGKRPRTCSQHVSPDCVLQAPHIATARTCFSVFGFSPSPSSILKRVESQIDSVIQFLMPGSRHALFLRRWLNAVLVWISPFVFYIDF